MLNILDFGAVGNGKTLNTEAFAQAVAAALPCGDTLCVPAGTFLTGTIDLRGVSLYLEAGAVIKGSPDPKDYPVQDYVHNEMGPLRALIVNLRHDHVSITGSGTIDLNGLAFFDTSRKNVPDFKAPPTPEQISECTYFIPPERPNQCIFFHDSRDVRLEGITVLNAPCWTITCSRCENIHLKGLTIDTDLNTPNDDGIHLSSCKGAIISDCHISSGDDCIALSCITDWETPCEDIVITNCVMRSCSKALVIGYMFSVVRNVTVTNCIIKESNRGFCIMCHDETALVENVRVSNCIIDAQVRAGNWWGNGEPLFLMAVPQMTDRTAPQIPARKVDCAIRNVHLSGITCMGENAMGIAGINGNIREITLSHIDYSRKPARSLSLKGNVFDLAPATLTCEVPEDCGLKITGAGDVTLDHVNTRRWRIIQEDE